MTRNNLLFRFGLSLIPFLLSASIASAATSISNSLKGFTGNSTQAATQTALTTAGFSISSIYGETEYPPDSGEFVNPTIQFDIGGAHFGDLAGNNAGRNYVRTNDADYANVSFVAEITFDAPSIDFQDIYFGLGAGNDNPEASRTPDWQTPNSSVMYWGESEVDDPTVTVYINDNVDGPSTYTPAPELAEFIQHRVRLSYDRYKQAATFSFDTNYVSGPFVADVTAPPAIVSGLYGADGWITEPARIFFGGDEGIVLKDFQVNVTSPPIPLFGDFNSSGSITSADWGILRANQHVDLSSMTQHAAYLQGDMTGDLANNFDDFIAFKALYDQTNGAGSFAAMVAGVPEPSTFLLILSAGIVALPTRRRLMQRA